VKGVVLFLLAVAIGAIATFLFLRPGIVANSLGLAGNLSFDGDSGQLNQTAFVPTLDTPIPDGKSAVWCASFQLAWDKLKSDVVKGPVEITNAKEVCDRLNKAAPAADELPPEAYFAAAGLVDNGIVATIQSEMAKRFPKVAQPEFGDLPKGILAYAYMEAKVDYGSPYLTNPHEFRFRGSGSTSNPLRSFGIPAESESEVPYKTRMQVSVLFANEETANQVLELASFAIDLDRSSHPYQVVLARVDWKGTLANTFAEVIRLGRSSVQADRSERDEEIRTAFNHDDTLLVPEMRWKALHNFRELLGPDKRLKIGDHALPVQAAEQVVAFRLDSRGAGVESSAKAAAAKAAEPFRPRHFHFDRPFLLYIKKRDAERPFFVMWVENAELMSSTGS
jgi:hypothetical protein